MAKQLTTRSKLARLAGVAPATVTKLCQKRLLPACDGKMVDLAHPLVVEYLRQRTEPRPEGLPDGIDPLFQQVSEWCAANNDWTYRGVQEQFRIGRVRTGSLLAIMRAAGLVPDPVAKTQAEPVAAVKPAAPKPMQAVRRGHQAARDKLKAEAWASAPPPDAPPEDGLVEIPADIQQFADMTLRELIDRFGTDVRFSDWLSATQKIEMINEKRLKNAETEGRLVSRELVKSGILDRIDAVFTRMLTDGAKTIASRAQAMAKAGDDIVDIRAMVEDTLGSFIRPAKVKMTEALRNA